jgi:hypothetical protein
MNHEIQKKDNIRKLASKQKYVPVPYPIRGVESSYEIVTLGQVNYVTLK